MNAWAKDFDAASDQASRRWVGKDALRDLTRPMVRARLARRSR